MATREPARFGPPGLDRHIALGSSPRGTLGLISSARALAVLRGRRFVVPQDVFDVAPEVLRHRVTLTYDALAEGVQPDDVIRAVLGHVPAPRISPQQDQVRATEVLGFASLPPPGRRMTQTQRAGATSVAEVAARAAVLRRLELEIPRRLDGSAAGDHLTSAIGPGSERAGARDYEAGDDARLIDWNLTARSLSTQVRTTEAEREIDTWVVVDRSASLDFGTARAEKRDVVLGAAAAFGMLTVRGHNRLGLVVAARTARQEYPPRTGRSWLMVALAGRLRHPAPGRRTARGPGPRGRAAAAARAPSDVAARSS